MAKDWKKIARDQKRTIAELERKIARMVAAASELLVVASEEASEDLQPGEAKEIRARLRRDPRY